MGKTLSRIPHAIGPYASDEFPTRDILENHRLSARRPADPNQIEHCRVTISEEDGGGGLVASAQTALTQCQQLPLGCELFREAEVCGVAVDRRPPFARLEEIQT